MTTERHIAGWPRPLSAAALAAAVVVALTGCSTPSTSTAAAGSAAPDSAPISTSGNPTALGTDPDIASLVPASLKATGRLVVASDPSYAPMEFYTSDNKTIVGMDPDLIAAAGHLMGLKTTIQQTSFDSIIPGLQSGKYTIGMSSFTDTADREKTVDFVTYFSAGTSLIVKKGNPAGLQPDGTSLCGKKIAVERGSIQAEDDIPARNKTCKTPMTALVYPDENGVNLALASGRADAILADSPVAAYAAKQSHGQFELSGSPYSTAPYGIVVPKTSTGLAKALQAALIKLQANGTYAKILAKWGVQSGALNTFQIDAAAR